MEEETRLQRILHHLRREWQIYVMLLPAIIMAIAILLIGIFNQFILNNVIQFAVPVGL